MPRYFLDVFKGADEIHSQTGIDAAGVKDAAAHAMHMCELLRDAVSGSGMTADNWVLVGRTETGTRLFAVNLSTVLSRSRSGGTR
jgi:hypothetical protein